MSETQPSLSSNIENNSENDKENSLLEKAAEVLHQTILHYHLQLQNKMC
jgi:hypothetical protein